MAKLTSNFDLIDSVHYYKYGGGKLIAPSNFLFDGDCKFTFSLSVSLAEDSLRLYKIDTIGQAIKVVPSIPVGSLYNPSLTTVDTNLFFIESWPLERAGDIYVLNKETLLPERKIEGIDLIPNEFSGMIYMKYFSGGHAKWWTC